MTKEDKRTGRQTGRGGGWGKGELRGGDVRRRRVSPCTLLSYEGGSIRVGLKDGGKRERYYYYSRKRPRRVLSKKALSLNIVFKHCLKFC